MRTKKFFPILIHIIVCVCWYVLNYLFLIGPEPGILTQYIYNFINQQLAIIMMMAIIIIGTGITFYVYFNVGKQIQDIKTNDKIISILGVIFFNLLILLAIFTCTKNISLTIYYSQLTINAPFFALIAQFKLSEFSSLIFCSTIPSIMMFCGAIWGRFEVTP